MVVPSPPSPSFLTLSWIILASASQRNCWEHHCFCPLSPTYSSTFICSFLIVLWIFFPLRDSVYLMYSFARADITKNRLGGFNNRNLFSHSSGGWKPKTKVSAELIASEASLLALRMTTLFLPLYVAEPLSTRASSVSFFL